MPEETYISDIFAADGRTDSTPGPQVAVAVDSGCADRDTLSTIPGDGPMAGEPEDATGV